MSYMEKFLDEKYINILYEQYNAMISNEKFKYQIEKLDKELTKYNGVSKNKREPEYSKYISMVYEKYLKNDNDKVTGRYKGFQDEKYIDLPMGYYFLLLFSKKFNDIIKFHEKHTEVEINENPILVYMRREIASEVKLLTGLLETMENVVAAVINSVDNMEVEYLDDNLENLDALGIKHRFLKAVMEKEKKVAFKLIGKFREMDQGEDAYLEALAYFTNEDYEDVIRYGIKLKPDDPDYGAAVAMMLESYAILGDSSSVVGILQYNKNMKYSKYHILYLKQILINALDFSNVENLNNALIELDEEFKDLETSVGEDYYFKEMANQYFAKVAVEGISLIEDAINYISINDDNNLRDETVNRLAKLRFILNLMGEEIQHILDLEYVLDKGLDKVKEEASTYFLIKLINDNEREAFSNLYVAFMTQYKLGFISEFCNNVENNILALVSYCANGEEMAEELIQLAYMEKVVAGEDSKELELIIKQLGVYKEDLEMNIKERQIEKFLSPKGKLAFNSAEWIYNKTLEEDYGWKDAGLLSLAYFRIIELELNEKIIIPMLDKIGFDNLEKAYNDSYLEFSGKDRDKYKRKWGILISGFRDIQDENKAIEGIMLGSMECFLKNISENYGEDELSKLIYKTLEEIFNSEGLEALKSGKIAEVIGYENRDKYRNPPAHTKFLNYEIACEAREFIMKEIINLSNYLAN